MCYQLNQLDLINRSIIWSIIGIRALAIIGESFLDLALLHTFLYPFIHSFTHVITTMAANPPTDNQDEETAAKAGGNGKSNPSNPSVTTKGKSESQSQQQGQENKDSGKANNTIGIKESKVESIDTKFEKALSDAGVEKDTPLGKKFIKYKAKLIKQSEGNGGYNGVLAVTTNTNCVGASPGVAHMFAEELVVLFPRKDKSNGMQILFFI